MAGFALPHLGKTAGLGFTATRFPKVLRSVVWMETVYRPCIQHVNTSMTWRWMSTLRAYTSAEAFPAITKGTLRIYSMRFCPYAQRARLVAAHKEIRFEEVNINLSDKPSWFLDKNPEGTVPVVHLGDHVICGSSICMEYLEATYRQRPLLPGTPYGVALMKMKMEALDKVPGRYYKVMGSDEDSREAAVTQLQAKLDDLETNMADDFFCGPNLTLADYFIWPWFERVQLMDSIKDTDVMPTSRYPRLTSWRDTMLETPGVRDTYQTVDLHLAYTKSALAGTPDFDIGVDNET